jgi:hypothetical protein
MTANTVAPAPADSHRGIVYVALGEAFVREAQLSAASLKRQHPGAQVTLFTDAPIASDLFDRIIPVFPAPQTLAEKKLAKVAYLAQSPYAQTLYLDTDTYICGDILGLFELLDHYDLAFRPAGAHYYRHEWPVLGNTMERLPAHFPQPSAGVLVFRKSPAVEAFFRLWVELFQRDQHTAELAGSTLTIGDQGSCREALYLSHLKVWSVPTEFNCMFNWPGYLFGPVRILHGRHRDLAAMAAFMNRRPVPRLYLRLYGYVWVVTGDGQIRGLRTPPNPVVKAGPLQRLWLGLDNALYWHGPGGALKWARDEVRRRLSARKKADR